VKITPEPPEEPHSCGVEPAACDVREGGVHDRAKEGGTAGSPARAAPRPFAARTGARR